MSPEMGMHDDSSIMSEEHENLFLKLISKMRELPLLISELSCHHASYVNNE